MRLIRNTCCFLACILLCWLSGYGQAVDSVTAKIANFPSKFFGRIQAKTADLDRQLTRQTEKYLERMARREARLKRKLWQVDSNAARNLFNSSAQKYSTLAQKIRTDTGSRSMSLSGEYQPYTDSLKSTLSFLQQYPQCLSGSNSAAKLQSSIKQLQQLQGKMQDADQVKAFIRQRKEEIGQYLSRYTHLPGGLGKEYQGLTHDQYYYSQQVRQYKEMLNDPDKLEQKALSLLGQLPAFQQFVKNNGQLAGLFNLPGNYGTAQGLVGLQTRDQVMSQVQNLAATGGDGGMAALQQSAQSAEQHLDQFKSKLNRLGGGSGDIDMPKFIPNNQRTKTFFHRLEYATNLQTTRTNYYFPTVTDFGLSVGYKLNNSSTAGLGIAYKLGWGNGIRNIALSSSGAALRSFVDVKIKGSFSATGALEYNYTTPFTGFQQIRKLERWSRSGLIGVSKTVSVKSTVFKKTKLQLLFDFLSFRQIPKTQPILFRLGYNF